MTIRFVSDVLMSNRNRAGFLLGCLCIIAVAADTPAPSSVTVAGSLQSEMGCPGDWQPDCAATHLAYDAEDGVWQGVFNVPAGAWEYKAPLNDSWEENYGANAQRDGPNIPLSLVAATEVKFFYDHETHWITDNFNSVIASVAGSFQSELGCSGDWQPWCLRSWLQDLDGDEIFGFTTSKLPAGGYEAKVAHDESWDENYGQDGVPNGPNIPFTVPSDCADMRFEYELSSHVLSISTAPPPAQPASVTIPGSFESELGCPGDWQPDCAATQLAFDADDTIWQRTFNIPAGDWEYRAALNDSWDINFGANATRDGPNILLSVGAATDVKFYYDDETNWVWDNQNKVIASLAGNFQSELGCPGDWQPWCLRSLLKDPDGDGLYTFSTGKLASGSYELKIAHNESWDENYGQDGVQNGANIPFTVPASCTDVFFTYDPATHTLTIGTVPQVDSDGDGKPDDQDNCPAEPNPDQTDTDLDGIGDACDNCIATANPDQTDSNDDGIGDACEVGAVTCDLDTDGDIDRRDISAITGLRNTTVPPSDPLADFDNNGIVNVIDARGCVLRCTRPRCAVQ